MMRHCQKFLLTALTLASSLALLLQLSCTLGTETGNQNHVGTETPNEFVVCVFEALSPEQIVAAAEAKAVFMPDTSSDTSRAVRFEADTDGKIKIDKARLAGDTIWSALITSSRGDSIAAWQDSIIVTADTIIMHNDTLRHVGSISGYVGLQPQHRNSAKYSAVMIQIKGSNLETNADETGFFRLKHVPAGFYTLQLNAQNPEDGYKLRSLQLEKLRDDDTTLSDTLKIPYDGMPVVTGLQAVFDSLAGVVQLSWNQLDTNFEYRILRKVETLPDEAITVGVSKTGAFNDTIFATGGFSVSDTLRRSLVYWVACRRKSTQEQGETFEWRTVNVVSYWIYRTDFTSVVKLASTGAAATAASTADTFLIEGTFANPLIPVKRICLNEGTAVVATDTLDSAITQGAWATRVRLTSAGVHTLSISPYDAAGRLLRADSTRIVLTTYQPSSEPAWQVRFTLVDGSPADSATVAITRRSGEALYAGLIGADGVLQLPKFPADTYTVDIWKVTGGDTLRARQASVPISPTGHGLTDDTLYASGTVGGTIALSQAGDGTVTDALVAIVNLNRQTTPDSSGRFLLTGIPVGTHTLTVSMPDTIRYTPRLVAVTMVDPWTPVLLSEPIRFEYNNSAPRLTPLNDVTVEENQPVVLTATASDDDGDPLTYSVDKSKLPVVNNAQFDSLSGVFSWTPTFNDAGAYTITLGASDGRLSTSITVTITVTDVNRPPVMTAIGDKEVQENATLTFTVTAQDPDGNPLSYSGDFDSLPGDHSATIDSTTGVFSWKPGLEHSGRYPLTFSASDGHASCSERITVIVTNVDQPPLFEPLPDKTVSENQLLAFTVDATDPDGDVVHLTADLTTLPAGHNAAFDASTKAFSWTPTYNDSGSWTISFSATSLNKTTLQTVRITVANVIRPPVVYKIPNDTTVAGRAFGAIDLDNYVNDPEYADNQLVWTMSPATHFTISLSPQRVVTITPKESSWTGSEAITFTATNPGGKSTSTSATFIVNEIIDGGLLKNGSFESANALGGITDWTFEGHDVEMAAIDYVSPGYEGRGSHCTAIIHPTGNASRWVQTVTGLTPGTRYKVSGYIRGEAVRTANENWMFAHLFRVDGTESSMLDYYFEGSFDWQYAEFTFVAPESGSATIGCGFGNLGSSLHLTTGTVWFDGISLTPANP